MAKKSASLLTRLQQEYNKQLRRIKNFIKGIEKRGYFFDGKQEEEVKKLLEKQYISSRHKEKISSKTVEALSKKKPDYFYSKAKYKDLEIVTPTAENNYSVTKEHIVSGKKGRQIERYDVANRAALTRLRKANNLIDTEYVRETREYDKRLQEEYEPVQHIKEKIEIEGREESLWNATQELEEKTPELEEPIVTPYVVDNAEEHGTSDLKLVDGQFLVDKSTGEIVDANPNLQWINNKYLVDKGTGEVIATRDGYEAVREADVIIDNVQDMIKAWEPLNWWKPDVEDKKERHKNTLSNILQGAIDKEGKIEVARRIGKHYKEFESHINTALYSPYVEQVQEALLAINYITLGRSPDVIESQDFEGEIEEEWEDYE